MKNSPCSRNTVENCQGLTSKLYCILQLDVNLIKHTWLYLNRKYVYMILVARECDYIKIAHILLSNVAVSGRKNVPDSLSVMLSM